MKDSGVDRRFILPKKNCAVDGQAVKACDGLRGGTLLPGLMAADGPTITLATKDEKLDAGSAAAG